MYITSACRVFEKEGVLVGDYSKGEAAAFNPSEDLNLWVLPVPLSLLLSRIVIFGKPIEVRLAQQLYGTEAAGVHRVLLGAFEGKQLKSTKLGEVTNAALATQRCPTIQSMRHVREHFSTELLLADPQLAAKIQAEEQRAHDYAIATKASNHGTKTAKGVYAGVMERLR